jgi:ATP-dependent exoDNAse (exonuclease V) alpha subunit
MPATAGGRGHGSVRDPVRRIPDGSLILADEGPMISLPHLSELVRHAAASGCKVMLAGDPGQLTAVEGGGTVMLLAGRCSLIHCWWCWCP